MKTSRTTEGLRNMLFDELDDFLTGKVDSEHVKTVSKISGAIMTTVSKDIEAAKLLKEVNEGRDQRKEIADLNLNLLLCSSIKSDTHS